MPKSEWVGWDAFPDPPKRQRRRGPPPPLKGEILMPGSEPTIVRVTITKEQRRSGVPRLSLIGVLIMLAFRFAHVLGIAAIVLVALAFAYPVIGLAAGVIVAPLVIIATLERGAGRPF
jgi:hypothetical protein